MFVVAEESSGAQTALSCIPLGPLLASTGGGVKWKRIELVLVIQGMVKQSGGGTQDPHRGDCWHLLLQLSVLERCVALG